MEPVQVRRASDDREVDELAVDLTLDTPEGYPWLDAAPPEDVGGDDAEAD